MRTLVESSRRLYKNYDPPKVSIEKIQELKDEGKITQEEHEYITK